MIFYAILIQHPNVTNRQISAYTTLHMHYAVKTKVVFVSALLIIVNYSQNALLVLHVIVFVQWLLMICCYCCCW